MQDTRWDDPSRIFRVIATTPGTPPARFAGRRRRSAVPLSQAHRLLLRIGVLCLRDQPDMLRWCIGNGDRGSKGPPYGAGRPTDACRVVPDGCMDVIWSAGRLVIAGPDTRAHVAPGVVDTITGLRYPPGVGPEVLGVPAHELRDRRVPLDEVWPSAEVRRLAEQAATAAATRPVLESASAVRLRDADGSPSPLPAILRGLARGQPMTAIAGSVGMSERQLHRRCLAAFGYGPKMLARVLRMHRALRAAAVSECRSPMSPPDPATPTRRTWRGTSRLWPASPLRDLT